MILPRVLQQELRDTSRVDQNEFVESKLYRAVGWEEEEHTTKQRLPKRWNSAKGGAWQGSVKEMSLGEWRRARKKRRSSWEVCFHYHGQTLPCLDWLRCLKYIRIELSWFSDFINWHSHSNDCSREGELIYCCKYEQQRRTWVRHWTWSYLLEM